jgi:hypothetical protein
MLRAMSTFEIPQAVPVRGGEVPVDVNTGDGLTKSQFEIVRKFFEEPLRFDEVAREVLRIEFTEKPEGNVATYLSHHAEELEEKDLLQAFGVADPDELTIDHLLDALQLKRIGLHPGSDTYAAVFDYSIDEKVTDYLLAVEFNEDGEVFDISMDS